MRVTSTEAQNNFGKYMRLAADLEEVIVTRNGRDTVKLVACRESPAGAAEDHLAEEAVGYLNNGAHRMTYQAFLEMSVQSDLRYEYIDGEVHLLASPTYEHQTAVSALMFGFMNGFQGTPCRVLTAPFDVTLRVNDRSINVVQPDIIVLCDPERVNANGRYEGVPSLVVEVLSPATRRKDMLKKLDLYLQSGVLEYWIVDPDAKRIMLYLFEAGDIREYRIADGGQTFGSIRFPELLMDASKVFG